MGLVKVSVWFFGTPHLKVWFVSNLEGSRTFKKYFILDI